MSIAADLATVRAFLATPTPAGWLEQAVAQQELLLIDHANCEKKAAATALSLMHRYVEHAGLLERMSRLAREELRHFEQVLDIMRERGISYRPLSAARYAGGLRAQLRATEPGRLVDTLLVGAIIEARSCERFAALVPYLDASLATFYRSLLRSEARHFVDYLRLAETVGSAAEVAQRLPVLLACEAALIDSPDDVFRFHSGVPAA